MGNALPALRETTFDIYLNSSAYWRNVLAVVWIYKLGGYQVLRKWLSYRERDILGRPLLPDEVQQFAFSVRRIAAIVRYMITASPSVDSWRRCQQSCIPPRRWSRTPTSLDE